MKTILFQNYILKYQKYQNFILFVQQIIKSLVHFKDLQEVQGNRI